MSEAATVPVTASSLPLDLSRSDNPLLARMQQEVKTAVHRELIGKVDLEKLLFMQDSRARQ